MADDIPLLKLAETCLAQSFLIFLVADLRLLSATGRIGTKFETLAIDNDFASKTCARDFCGHTTTFQNKSRRGDDGNSTASNSHDVIGLTPSHIMAVLLLEINREVKANKASSKGRHDRDEEDEDSEVLLGSRGRKEKGTNEMHSLLKGYSDLIFSDLVDEIPKVKKARSDRILSAIREVDSSLTEEEKKGPEGQEEEQEVSLHSHAAFTRRAETLSSLQMSFVSMHDVSIKDHDFEDEELFRVPRPQLGRKARSFTKKLLKQQGFTAPEKHTLRSDIERVQSRVFHLQGGSPFAQLVNADAEQFYEGDELENAMERAVLSRRRGRLDFMKNFFQEGSVSRVMAESKAELVWLQDWHTSKECTYAISVDKEKKTVLLAFRGAITRADWGHIIDWNPTKTVNPVKEDYPGRLNWIKMHGGFHRYIFRQRKDTGTTKYDEIATKLEYYMNEVVGEGCKLLITGHSLGAALSIVFSFYASTEKRFTQHGPVEVVNFGCPLVAGYQLADAVRHQERMGRLRLVRFRCKRDGVPHGPPTLFRMTKRGAAYFHVGIDVNMPMIRKSIFKVFGQPQPKIRYLDRESFMQSYARQIYDFYFWNIPLRPWLIGKMHSLAEHQQRILLIDHENSPLAKCTLKELYELHHVVNSDKEEP